MKNTTILLLITLIAFAYSQQQCPVGCSNCTSTNTTINCTSCAVGNFLVNTTCPRCPNNCVDCYPNAQGRPVCTNCTAPSKVNAQGGCFLCDPSCLDCSNGPTNCTSCREGTELQPSVNGTSRCGPLANCSFANCAQCGPGPQNRTVCTRCIRGFFAFRERCVPCKFPCKDCLYNKNVTFLVVSNIWQVMIAPLVGLSYPINRTGLPPLPLPLFMENLDWQNMNETSKDGWIEAYLGLQFFTTQIRQLANVSTLQNFNLTEILRPLQNITGEVDGPLLAVINRIFVKNFTLQQFYNRTFAFADTLTACVACSDGFQEAPNNFTSPCQKCAPRCLVCDNNTCSSCEPGFFLDNGACLRCNQTCLECSGTATTCTKCAPPTSLAGTSCVMCNNTACATCTAGNTNICITCKLPFSSVPDNGGACYRCGQDLCKTCQPPAQVGNQTVSICNQCKAGSTLVDGKCLICPLNCQSCSSGATPVCFQCKPGFSLISQNNLTRCGTCPPGCLQCSDTNSSICLACIQGTFLNSNAVCQRCKDGCLKCTSLEECTAFQAGVVIISGQVVKCRPGCKTCDLSRPDVCTQCSPRYFLDNSNCRLCQPGCIQCSDATTCTKCADNLNLDGGNCTQCQGNCRTCPLANNTQCLTCKRGTVLVGTQCLKQCERGCLECDPTNSSICLTCALGHALKPNGKCVKCLKSCSGTCDPRNINQCLSCVDGFELSSGQCKRCPKGCATCLNGQCQTCVVGFRLTQNAAGSFICAENCRPPCSECTQTSCLACDAGFNLTNGVCQPFTSCNPLCPFCPSGTYKHDASGQCRRCMDNCASCVDGTSCLQCQGGFYRSNNQCVACPAKCKTCYDGNRCIECSPRFVKQIVSMDADVSGAVYSDNCISCDSNCLTCQVQAERCTSCPDGARLFSSRCAGMFTVVYEFILNYDYALFLENSESQVFIQAVTVLLGINSNDNYISSIRNGSVAVAGQASSSSQQQAQSMTNTLGSAGGSLGGFSVSSASTSVYYGDSVYVAPPATQEVKQAEKPNVGLIVGVVVGGVVLIAIVAILIYKFKCQKPSVNDGGEASGIQLNQKGRR